MIRIDQTGVRYVRLTRLIRLDPGIPSSRAKAYHILAIEVMDDAPQSHIATPMMTAIRLAKKVDRFP